MGPELLTAAVVGPMFGGIMSVMIWLGKKNSEKIDTGFAKLNTSVNVIERKVDSLQLEVVKNYATRGDLINEIHDLKREMKTALDDSKQRGERLYNEIEELRKFYWDTRETLYHRDDERDNDTRRS